MVVSKKDRQLGQSAEKQNSILIINSYFVIMVRMIVRPVLLLDL